MNLHSSINIYVLNSLKMVWKGDSHPSCQVQFPGREVGVLGLVPLQTYMYTNWLYDMWIWIKVCHKPVVAGLQLGRVTLSKTFQKISHFINIISTNNQYKQCLLLDSSLQYISEHYKHCKNPIHWEYCSRWELYCHQNQFVLHIYVTMEHILERIFSHQLNYITFFHYKAKLQAKFSMESSIYTYYQVGKEGICKHDENRLGASSEKMLWNC